jgi:hypothetical protein
MLLLKHDSASANPVTNQGRSPGTVEVESEVVVAVVNMRELPEKTGRPAINTEIGNRKKLLFIIIIVVTSNIIYLSKVTERGPQLPVTPKFLVLRLKSGVYPYFMQDLYRSCCLK